MRFRTTLAALLAALLAGVAVAQAPASLQDGVDLFEAGDPEAAAEFFSGIEVAQGPERFWSDYYLGRLEFDRSEWDAAIERLSAAVEADADNALFHRWLGQAYVEKIDTVNAFKKMGLANKGRDHFEEAVRLAPEDFEAREALVGYYTNAPSFAGGSREKAEQQVAELKEIAPDKGHALAGLLHFNEGEWKEAEAAYRAAIESDPENPDYRYRFGFCRQQQDDHAGAVEAFEKAIDLDAEYMPAYYQIGRTAAFSSENLERGAEALGIYLDRPARRGEPGHEHAHWRLGMVYEHLGKKQMAADAYRASLAIDPDHEQSKKALAKLD